jgi:hypothetical protein
MSPSSRLKMVFSQRTVSAECRLRQLCNIRSTSLSLYVTYSFKEMHFRSNDTSQLYETDCFHWL